MRKNIKLLLVIFIVICILPSILNPSKIVAVKSEYLILTGNYDDAAHNIMDYYNNQENKDTLDPELKQILTGLKLNVSENNLYPMDKILLHVDGIE